MARRGAHEGSIYRRRDGRWAGSISLGYAHGTRQRKTYYGRTRQAVALALSKALREHQQGLPVGVDDRLTLAEFLMQWLASTRASLRPNTYVRYEQLLRRHVLPSLGKRPLSKVTPQELQAVLNGKVADGLSPRTIGHIRAVLRASLTQAMRWGVVGRNIAALVDVPRIPTHELRTLTPEQARRLLGETASDRAGALYAVALSTGARQGELLGLHWSDVDLEESIIHIRSALQRVGGRLTLVEPKTVRSRRSVPLPRLAVEALRTHRVRQMEERLRTGLAWHEDGFVFTTAMGTPLEATNVTREFQRALTRAGLPRQRFHDLRHACASFLLVQGVHPRVVMETLGHSQIATTLDIYSHVSSDLQRDAAMKLGNLLG
jgi:integrase